MTENILYRIRNGDVQLLEEAVASWKRERHNGELVGELESALVVCLGLPEQLHEVRHSVLKKRGAFPAEEYQNTGVRLRDFFDRALRASESLRDLIGEFQGDGHSISRFDELERAIDRLNQLRSDFVDGWLWITPEITREAMEEYARGEYQTVREILDELQSKNP